MCFIYILGGGPGAGKSTIAKALSEKYDLEYLRADDFVGEHQQEAAERKYPMNSYLSSLPEDEQQIELIRLTYRQEIARQEELFFVLLKELRKRDIDKIILEGNCLLPGLVHERFEYPYKGVWLLPTLKFQEDLYPKRDWVPGLLKQSDAPSLTLVNWIRRDHKFNKEVLTQAKAHKFPYLRVNGQLSLKDTQKWVEQNLKLKQLTAVKQ